MPDYPPIEVVEESDPPAQDVTAEAVLLDEVDEVAEDAEQVEEPSAALVPFDALQRYLSEIRHYPVLTREEEHDLAVQYKELATSRPPTSWSGRISAVVMIARGSTSGHSATSWT